MPLPFALQTTVQGLASLLCPLLHGTSAERSALLTAPEATEDPCPAPITPVTSPSTPYSQRGADAGPVLGPCNPLISPSRAWYPSIPSSCCVTISLTLKTFLSPRFSPYPMGKARCCLRMDPPGDSPPNRQRLSPCLPLLTLELLFLGRGREMISFYFTTEI